jgi:hypothetical protein
VTVSASGTKTETWLAAHMNNPFRDWVDDSRAFGTAACRAYTTARSAVDAAPAAGPHREPAVQAALRGLIADLNAINARFEQIDTINREHAIDVYLELARHANTDIALAEQWVDEDRQW